MAILKVQNQTPYTLFAEILRDPDGFPGMTPPNSNAPHPQAPEYSIVFLHPRTYQKISETLRGSWDKRSQSFVPVNMNASIEQKDGSRFVFTEFKPALQVVISNGDGLLIVGTIDLD